MIGWEQDADGVVVLTLDDPTQAVNTMNAAYAAAMEATVARLEAERETVTGVVVTSAKRTFFAGGDLHALRAVTPETAEAFAAFLDGVKRSLRRLETLGVPVVAAIDGAALGGGLEIALATHHRVVVDGPQVQLGFPEVTLGLLPGAGGVVRSVRLLGLAAALPELLLQGRRLSPARALALGLVDEVVATRAELLPAAKAWIAARPAGAPTLQRWDVKGYKIPGGTPADPKLAANLPAFPANLRKQLKGANFPAPHHILAAAVESTQVDVDTASEIEGRYFLDLVGGQVAKNMIQAFFFDLQAVNGDRGRPRDAEPFRPAKMVVLGAGMMGAAIAYVCAKAGIAVVLKDVEQAAADKGKAYSERLVAKDVDKGRLGAEAGAALLARILPTADAADAAGAELVIEAVFEDPEVKAQVFAEIEPHLAAGALLGSNTSTLPITQLADGVSRPAAFIGLHFFSPVDKMPLLEIVRGEQTSDATLYRALDVARLIDKTPIVVNDARGFFTSRVIAAFLNEGLAMLAEGVPPASIEQASSQAGYPAPVLQLTDELKISLMWKIREEARLAAEREGSAWTVHPADAVMRRMVEELDRGGRAAGAGFYDYADGRRAGLWPGLREHYPPVADPSSIALEELGERMLFAEALETVTCLDEGVLESVADANVGSVIGIGFPGWTGGVLQYVNQYAGGLEGFVARARELAERYGERFEPPASLVAKAQRGETYTDTPAPALELA